jgi:membrane protease YdiL (CAAX protease family)
MVRSMSKNKPNGILYAIVVGLAALLFLEIFHEKIFGSELMGELLYSITTRFLGSLVCILVIYKYSAKRILTTCPRGRALLFILPCMAIAVNNFPFLAYMRGDAYISGGKTEIILFAIMCIGVGLFEELAFRGCVFTLILKNRRKTVKEIFVSIALSSGIFGMIHLTNLFAGASPASVFLQIGYSFLIGGMCSMVLIKTGNIFCSAAVHAVYNFAGLIIPTLGGGNMLNLPTVIVTALLAIAVAIYIVIGLVRFEPRRLDSIFEKEESERA